MTQLIAHVQMQILYLEKTHMPNVHVNDVFPLCSFWMDQLIKSRLTVKIESYDNYGHVDVSL